ncbi:AAA domain family protein [Streptococcus mitis]|uniref:AAA domain family protein n=1 Tax=Streptococcus mitis TaxID=28037 RepID=A0A081QQJ9_STRMT|nr:McrB family protein [Streptococcus mitis]KEQ45222.1 AAA domain family protein [Streptococcus mitis]
MNKRKVSLEDFYKWYSLNKEELLNKATAGEKFNDKLKEEFLQEWPLNRILTMSIDEYVIGKGQQNKSLCYALEKGKYKNLFLGISGGSASKFGIYWNEKTKSYKDQGNKVIPLSELDQRFSKLKSDLYEIIKEGIRFNFENPIFDMKRSTNEFVGRSAMVTKLLCIYSEGYPFFGVNINSQKEFWSHFVSQTTQGGPYLQNHKIIDLLSKTYPELEPSKLGTMLFEYSKLFMENKEENSTMDSSNNFRHQLTQTLLQSKNLILRGAPGTGKTYLAKEIAKDLTEGHEEQIGFVQFHPSYDYTDFVEGLRPVSNGDGAIEFKLEDGIFKKFCQRAKEAQKTGGQDNFEETWAKLTDAINEKQGQYFFPRSSVPASLNSQGNVKFDSPVATKEKVYLLYKGEDTNLKYETYQNIVLDHMKESYGLCDYVSPTIDTDKKFVFIIDEINRGEISKIFGELFFSIDKGYRGEKGSVSTQYANLHETDEKFYIPENVYIIGTMNDIDRSVDTFDFAMRRRFRFVEVTAESQLYILDKELGNRAEEAKTRLRNLNAAIENVQELNSHYHIGPSYFLDLNDVDFDYELLWSDYLKPLLEDYIRGSYEEAEILETLKKAFDLTKNEQKDQAVADDNEGDENDDADY